MDPCNWYVVALERLRWTEVTLWYRSTNGLLEYNHLENGHSPHAEPKARSPEQSRAWRGAHWSKRLWFAQAGTILSVLPEAEA